MTHLMIRKNSSLALLCMFMVGCVPVPDVERVDQKISSLHTSEYSKIVATKKLLNSKAYKRIDNIINLLNS